ncbi:MAG: hypothetical protein AB7I30_06815 [Isosphaeraceae bacterium]
MTRTKSFPVCGNSREDLATGGETTVVGRHPEFSTPPRRLATFAKLVELHQGYDRLLQELRVIDRQRESARAYFKSVGGNPTLALARLRQLRIRRETLMATLQRNRSESLALLFHLDRDAA